MTNHVGYVMTDQEFRVSGMPAKLIDAVGVAAAGVLLVKPFAAEVVDGHGLVVGARGQPLAVAAPVDGVNLGAVSGVLPLLVLLLTSVL